MFWWFPESSWPWSSIFRDGCWKGQNCGLWTTRTADKCFLKWNSSSAWSINQCVLIFNVCNRTISQLIHFFFFSSRHFGHYSLCLSLFRIMKMYPLWIKTFIDVEARETQSSNILSERETKAFNVDEVSLWVLSLSFSMKDNNRVLLYSDTARDWLRSVELD